MRKLIVATVFLFINAFTFAQMTINGQVKDEKTQEALIGATIIYNDSIYMTSDENGVFSIQADNIYNIKVQYVGYISFFKKITQKIDNLDLVVELKAEVSILNTLVVTGSNYEKNIIEEPVSIEVIRPEYIRNNNINTLETAMQRVPGVQVSGGQASIRSSGFSVGAGSRVGIVVDGLPMLGGEGSEVRWDFVPLENAEQIEVIKGPSSVLYGSSAMNGVINVRTAYPTSKPYTNITLYSGVSDNIREPYRQWWNGYSDAPYNAGVFLSHRQKLNKFDVVFGGNAHRNIGHIQRDNSERLRANLNTRYRASDKLIFELSTNGMYNSQSSYLSWLDGDTSVLQPLDSLFYNRYYNYSLTPSITYYHHKNHKHILRGRYFNTTYIRRAREEYIPVGMVYGEYQYQGKLGERGAVTGGASYQNYFATSPNFGRDSVTGEFISASASIGSVYAQLEYNFFKKKLNIVAGGRLEFIDANVEDYQIALPVFRLSSTYKVSEKDILRFSAGQGYRLPSLAERFVSQRLIRVYFPPFFDFDFGLQANPSLRPEYGWSAEVGYKKVVNKGNWQGFVDVAAFAMRYYDMIYLTLDYHKDLGRPFLFNDLFDDPTPLGYRYINIENTLVSGVEVSTTMNGKIGQVPFRIWAGYTYTYPGNLDSISIRNESYIQNFFKSITLRDSTMYSSILTYRSLHVARFDIEFYWKKLTFGGVANLDGHMINIDAILEGKGYWGPFVQFLAGDILLPGVVDFRENNPKYNWIFDFRIGYQLNEHHNINLVINNLMNTTYAFQPGRINPLRTFNLKYALTF